MLVARALAQDKSIVLLDPSSNIECSKLSMTPF